MSIIFGMAAMLFLCPKVLHNIFFGMAALPFLWNGRVYESIKQYLDMKYYDLKLKHEGFKPISRFQMEFRISDPIQNPDHLQPNLFLTIGNPDKSRFQISTVYVSNLHPHYLLYFLDFHADSFADFSTAMPIKITLFYVGENSWFGISTDH